MMVLEFGGSYRIVSALETLGGELVVILVFGLWFLQLRSVVLVFEVS